MAGFVVCRLLLVCGVLTWLLYPWTKDNIPWALILTISFKTSLEVRQAILSATLLGHLYQLDLVPVIFEEKLVVPPPFAIWLRAKAITAINFDIVEVFSWLAMRFVGLLLF